MADLRVLHVVPRFHDGGPTASLLAEQRHGRRLGAEVAFDILALEPGGSSRLVLQALRQRLRVHVAPGPERETELLSTADVVVLDWWNTPSMWSFVDRHRGTALRWVLHSRVNGRYAPQFLPESLASAPCHLLLTSPDGFDLRRDGQATVVTDILDVPTDPPSVGRGSRLVHIGTVNVAKLDPAVVDVHRSATAAGATVAVLGSGGDEERFRHRAERLGVADRIAFPGFVESVDPWLREAVAFVAPTSRFTYASCDKTVQDAQLRGVATITYAHSPIAHLVIEGATGWLARDRDHFAEIAAEVVTGKRSLHSARVAATAQQQHGPDAKIRTLMEVYRRVGAAAPRPLDDGYPDLAAWIDLQCGPTSRGPGIAAESARRPDLVDLIADDALLDAHLRWACEGGVAQFLSAFGPDTLNGIGPLAPGRQ